MLWEFVCVVFFSGAFSDREKRGMFFLIFLDDDDYQEKNDDNKFVCFMKQRKRKIKQQRQKNIDERPKEN